MAGERGPGRGDATRSAKSRRSVGSSGSENRVDCPSHGQGWSGFARNAVTRPGIDVRIQRRRDPVAELSFDEAATDHRTDRGVVKKAFKIVLPLLLIALAAGEVV